MLFEMFRALPPGLQRLAQGPASAVQTPLQPEGAQNVPKELNPSLQLFH